MNIPPLYISLSFCCKKLWFQWTNSFRNIAIPLPLWAGYFNWYKMRAWLPWKFRNILLQDGYITAKSDDCTSLPLYFQCSRYLLRRISSQALLQAAFRSEAGSKKLLHPQSMNTLERCYARHGTLLRACRNICYILAESAAVFLHPLKIA